MSKIKIQLEKENPLKTILKHGKIPVIRRSNDGFQDFLQDVYFQSKGLINKYKNVYGCFAQIGGMQGRWVSGNHNNEKICIGYLEPNTKVLATYRKKAYNEFQYITAKERFEEGLLLYTLYHQNSNFYWPNMDIEDFDIMTEAIISSKDIHKVCEIEPKNFYQLLPYVKDGFLRILTVEDIFYESYQIVPLDFYQLIGVDNGDTLFGKLYDYKSNMQVYAKFILRKATKCYYHYMLGEMDKIEVNCVKHIENALEKFSKWNIAFLEKKEGYCPSYENKIKSTPKLLEYDFSNGKNYKFTYYFDKEFILTLNIPNQKVISDYYDNKISYNNYIMNKYKVIHIKNDEILKKDYIFYLFDFYTVLTKNIEFLGEIFDISYSPLFDKVKFYKDIYENFENVEFSENLDIIYFTIGDLKIEYNTILRDAIFEIDKNEYVNIEHLPKKYSYVIEPILGLINKNKQLERN